MPDPQRRDTRTRSRGWSWSRALTPEIAARLEELEGARREPEARLVATADPLDLSNLGPALRHLRHTRELTQPDVAQRAGVTKAMVSSYETAARLPSVRTLTRLLGALDADFKELHEAMESIGRSQGGTVEARGEHHRRR